MRIDPITPPPVSSSDWYSRSRDEAGSVCVDAAEPPPVVAKGSDASPSTACPPAAILLLYARASLSWFSACGYGQPSTRWCTCRVCDARSREVFHCSTNGVPPTTTAATTSTSASARIAIMRRRNDLRTRTTSAVSVASSNVAGRHCGLGPPPVPASLFACIITPAPALSAVGTQTPHHANAPQSSNLKWCRAYPPSPAPSPRRGAAYALT